METPQDQAPLIGGQTVPTRAPLLPNTGPTRMDRLDYERSIETGFGGLVWNAARNTTSAPIIDHAYQKLMYAPDRGWRPDAKFFKELTEGRPEQALEYVASAVSEEHAYYLLARFDQRMKMSEQVAQWGGTGIAVSFAAEFMDPANIATGFAAGSMARGLRSVAAGSRSLNGLRQAGRLKTVSTEVAAGTVADAGVETLRTQLDPLAGPEDILLGVTAGAAFSGGMSSFRRSDLAPVARVMQKAADRTRNSYLGQKLLNMRADADDAPVLQLIREKSPQHEQRVNEIVDQRNIRRPLAAVLNSFTPEFLGRFRLKFTEDHLIANSPTMAGNYATNPPGPDHPQRRRQPLRPGCPSAGG